MRNETRNGTDGPFFLHPFGAERITANHCTDGSLYFPTEFGRFCVGVLDARPGIPCLVRVRRVLRGSESGPWAVVRSGLVVSHEFGVGAGSGKLWVMMTGGRVNGGIVLLLWN